MFDLILFSQLAHTILGDTLNTAVDSVVLADAQIDVAMMATIKSNDLKIFDIMSL
jgi:hypothetical protein